MLVGCSSLYEPICRWRLLTTPFFPPVFLLQSGARAPMQQLELSNDERVMKAALYGEHVKRFTYAMLVLAYLNSLARADVTASICTIGLMSLWFRRKDVALTVCGSAAPRLPY